jgi:hypothetical protein
MYRQWCLVVTQHYRRHLCKLFPMLQPSDHCCERTHDCACTVVVALTQIRCLTNGSDHANLIWLITSEVLPPSAIRKREVIVNFFFLVVVVVEQINLAVGRLVVEVSRSHTDTHTPTHTYSAGLLKTSDQLVAEDVSDTTHNTLKRRTSMPWAGFEPAIPQSRDSITLTATEIGSQPIRGSVSSQQLELSSFLCRMPTFVELAIWEVQYNVVC